MKSSQFFRIIRSSVVSLALFTVVCGLVFPALVWGISRVFPSADAKPITQSAAEAQQASGSSSSASGACTLALKNLAAARPASEADQGANAPTAPSVPAGSEDPWFHYRPLDSTNAGPSSSAQASVIEQRRKEIAEREHVSESAVPADAVTSSFSGVEATISPAYAELQIPRVAEANHMSQQQVRELVDRYTTKKPLGVFGADSVNVTELDAHLPAARCTS